MSAKKRSPDEAVKSFYRRVDKLLREGQSPKQIESSLVEAGIDQETASTVVQNAVQMQSVTRGRDLSHKVKPKSTIIKRTEQSILTRGLVILVWTIVVVFLAWIMYQIYPMFTMRFSGWAGLWDVRTGRELLKLDKFDRGMVESVDFSPDGRILATGSRDNAVRLWDVATGRELLKLKGHSTQQGVIFSPDGKTLAYWAGDHSRSDIYLWDVATGKRLLKLSIRYSFVRSLAFSPDGKTLAGAGRNYIWLWDVTTGEELVKLEARDKGFYRFVGFLPDGQILGIYLKASGRGPSKLLWGLLDMLLVDVVSPDGKILETVSFNNFIGRLSDVGTGRAVITFRGSDFEFIFSLDGKTLASWGIANYHYLPDGETPAPYNWSTVHLWDVATGDQIFPLNTGIYSVKSVAFSPDGKTLAAGGR